MPQKLFFVLTMITSLSSFSQVTFPFPKDSAIWSVAEEYWAQLPSDRGCIAKHYAICCDTMIGGETWSKLYSLQDVPSYTDSGFQLGIKSKRADIRQDTTGKVWVNGTLYYDFALNLGDTFCFDYFGQGCYPVVYVDSVLIGGRHRRTIQFSTPNGETWIEGIGSTTGWFQWQYVGTWSWNLWCFKEGNKLLYNATGTCHCDTYSGFENETHSDFVISVFPSPATTIINIHAETTFKKEPELEVYSAQGQKLWSFKLTDQHSSIDITGISAGIYYLVVRRKNTTGVAHSFYVIR